MAGDDADDQEEAPATEHADSFVEQVAHVFVMAHTGIPPQIQKNFYTAFGHVVGHAIGPVTAWFDRHKKLITAGGDTKIAAMKVQQKADAVTVRKSAELTARLMEVSSDLQIRSLQYEYEKSFREQANREDVIRAASDIVVAELDRNPRDATSDIEIDWLAAFFAEAGKRSTSDFKQLFARILAGEVKAPGTFSIGTVMAVSRLTKETAQIFQDFCNISFKIEDGVKIIGDPFPAAGTNGLTRFGLGYVNLIRLVEDGLLRPDFNEEYYSSIQAGAAVELEYCGEKFYYVPKPEFGLEPKMFSVRGPSATTAGAELRLVTPCIPPKDYLPEVAKWFSSQNIALCRLLEKNGTTLNGQLVEQAP